MKEKGLFFRPIILRRLKIQQPKFGLQFESLFQENTDETGEMNENFTSIFVHQTQAQNEEMFTAYNGADICNPEHFMQMVIYWCIGFIGIGVISFFGFALTSWLFATSGERLTERLREKSFRKYLQLEISYFDDPENTTGALTTRLSTDAAKIQDRIYNI